MMKRLFLFSFAILMGLNMNNTFAQSGNSFYSEPYAARNNGTFDRLTNIVSIGYGFPATFNNDFNSTGVFGPLLIKYQRGIINEVGIGVRFLGAGAVNKNKNYTNKSQSFGLDLLGYYHFNKFIPLKQLDVYVGAGPGLRWFHYRYDDKSPINVEQKSNFKITGVYLLGARWYFTHGFGVFVEGGYSNYPMNYANAGVSFRF